MLEARFKIQRRNQSRSGRSKTIPPSHDQITAATTSDASSDTLQKYFEAAMSRFLADQRGPIIDQGAVKVQDQGSQDVEMEPVRFEHSTSRWEYDPDDIDFLTVARAMVATATTGSAGSTMIQRVRISAISDFKEFTGKYQDEDRTRIGKVKSAFMRDQASDEENAWPSRIYWLDPPRTNLPVTNGLICSELSKIQYCGLVVSVARQYYHTRRRPEESPLDYLYRLSVAGLRTKLKIKDGNAKDRREHVDHYIETLKDQDLTNRLTLLRLSDADDLEEVLRGRESDPMDQMDLTRIETIIGGSTWQLSRMSPQRWNLVEQVPITHKSTDQAPPDHRSRIQSGGSDRNRCSHCGSKKHSDLGCWRLLTCHKCGKRGHPADRCLFVCRGSANGSTQPNTQACFRICREDVKLERSPGLESAERSRYCIYAFVNKRSVDRGSKNPDLRGNTYDLNENRAVTISSVCQVDDLK
ncbi:LOW QUALITY PROTEIN: Hypothetical protein PHPALM_16976 [Phytophthora palmivora]|uniref:CCHC-type domain-containing protein n=1 Tax=Phytophthora palmivora TaxID=4796 RepID=A0A2P4XNE1_9STRA|nr:LOW QUALITY PROTEIN: Hypothetical protein PHPALM_16976 [Phytophthora palmivora]